MPVYKNSKLGTWFVQCAYRNYTGERIRTTKRGFKTRKQAQNWERGFVRRKEGALDISIAAFYELYEQDVRPRLKENAWNTKVYIIETKIIPYLGDLKISEVTAADVLHWQNDIQSLTDSSGQPYSPTYLRTIRNQLSAIFNHAIRYYPHHTRKMGDGDVFNTISRSNGLMGCADETMVLKKKSRGSSSAALSIPGRDIKDQELTLRFVNRR